PLDYTQSQWLDVRWPPGYSKVTEVISAEGIKRLLPRGQHFTHAPENVMLLFVHRQKFKTVSQSNSVAHQRPYFQRIRRQGQREFHRNHFARLQFSRQGSAHAILSQLIRASPQRYRLARAKNLH